MRRRGALLAILAAALAGSGSVAAAAAAPPGETETCSAESAGSCGPWDSAQEQDSDLHEVVLLQRGLQKRRAFAPPPGEPALRDKRSATHPRGSSQAFVQLFEWSWRDVAKECVDWLGPKGFTAVLVSPPNEHVVGESWYYRYQPVSYNLTSRSGNESEFISMVQRCKAAGVGVYIDAVFNHCAPMSGVGIAGSKFGSRTYPLYGPEDFHHNAGDPSANCGVSDYWNKSNVQYCDLQGMPDLCTGCERVQATVAAYLNRLANLGVAGFRVDAAKHMDAGELGQLLSRVNPSMFHFQEVMASLGEVVQSPMYYANGPVTEFAYPATLSPKFGKNLLRDDLATFGETWGFAPRENAIVFVDDHDSQRNGAAPLTHKSGKVYELVTIFMLAHPYGYPKVMSSYYFSDPQQGPPATPVHGSTGILHCGDGEAWVCEHRRPAVANMVAWRRAAGDAPVQNLRTGGDTLFFCRGESACLALNLREKPWELKVQLPLPEGDYCNVAVADHAGCPRIHVGSDGGTVLKVPARGAVAFHTNAYTDADKDLQDSLPLT